MWGDGNWKVYWVLWECLCGTDMINEAGRLCLFCQLCVLIYGAFSVLEVHSTVIADHAGFACFGTWYKTLPMYTGKLDIFWSRYSYVLIVLQENGGKCVVLLEKNPKKWNPKTKKKEKQVRNVSLFSGLSNDFRCWLCWQFDIIFSPACPSLALFGGREWRLPVASLGVPVCSLTPSLLPSTSSPLALPLCAACSLFKK